MATDQNKHRYRPLFFIVFIFNSFRQFNFQKLYHRRVIVWLHSPFFRWLIVCNAFDVCFVYFWQAFSVDRWVRRLSYIKTANGKRCFWRTPCGLGLFSRCWVNMAMESNLDGCLLVCSWRILSTLVLPNRFLKLYFILPMNIIYLCMYRFSE